MNDSEIDDFFIVERQYVIAITVKVKEIIFVSMRGTQQIHDWIINLNPMKYRPHPYKNIDIFFHKNFHKAATSCISEIFQKPQNVIRKKKYTLQVIPLVGH